MREAGGLWHRAAPHTCIRCGPRRRRSPSSCPGSLDLAWVATTPRVSIAACPTDTEHVCRALTVISGYLFFSFVVLKRTKKKKKCLDSLTSALAAGWLNGRVGGVAAPNPWHLGVFAFSSVFMPKILCCELSTMSDVPGDCVWGLKSVE